MVVGRVVRIGIFNRVFATYRLELGVVEVRPDHRVMRRA